MREIFISLLLTGSKTFQYMHVHPEVTAYPSESDIQVTNDIIQAATLLRIDFDNHIIIGDDGYYSLKEVEEEESREGRNNLPYI